MKAAAAEGGNGGPGCLYLVATPIGNLGDLSPRALEALKASGLVAAEDTRVTRGLLTHFGLSKPLISCHGHNERGRIPEILGALGRGVCVALVSDAGTPGVSDPGTDMALAVIEAGYRVVPIPGPSAVTTALAASGLATQPFYFHGFLPAKSKDRREALQGLKALPATLVFFESPHRVRDLLDDLLAELGDRPAALCRELTKLHEEILRGALSGLAGKIPAPRGEFTVVVAGATEAPVIADPDAGLSLEARLRKAVAAGMSPNQAVAQVARATGLPRAQVYQAAHGLGRG